MKYEFDDLDRRLIAKLRPALQYAREGDPIKDFLDEDDLVEAAELLLAVIDAETDKGPK